MRHVAQRFDVVDDGGLAPQTAYLWIGRLGARIGALAFERIEQRGLFPAYVAPGADMQVQLEAVFRAEDIPAQIAVAVCFGDCLLQPLRRQLVSPAQENVTHVGLDRIRTYDHAFYQLVWIAFKQQAVLECAGFHLVCVADEILGMRRIISHRHETPFLCGRKTRSAAPAQVRLLYCRHDFAWRHAQRLAQRHIATRLLVLREIRRFFSRRDVTGQRCFHRQALFFPFFLSVDTSDTSRGFHRPWQDPGPGNARRRSSSPAHGRRRRGIHLAAG